MYSVLVYLFVVVLVTVLIFFDSLISSLFFICFFFLMIRRPPRSTLDRSSAASDVYKRQTCGRPRPSRRAPTRATRSRTATSSSCSAARWAWSSRGAVSYTHLRAHETVLDLVCRLLLEKKKISTIAKHDTTHHSETQSNEHLVLAADRDKHDS